MAPQSPGPLRQLLSRPSWPEAQRVRDLLRKETVGGILLLSGTVIALVWANSPIKESYRTVAHYEIGPSSLHLNLSLEAWAADGLLAIFFFVAGLELKREFVAGDLRSPRRALVPVAAAIGGMTAPAVLYTVINLGSTDGALSGWAIPTATDIAFALAVLAVISTHLPSALRTFLLTLAVVDDLLAIVIIACFYTGELHPQWLFLALIPLGAFTFLVQRQVRAWWMLLPLALVTWALVHASGIHATVAGVLLGFAVPVLPKPKAEPAKPGGHPGPGLAEHFEHRFRPLSAGIAVPVFAFFAAGVTVGGWSGLTDALGDKIAIGIIVALVAGKTIGVTGGTAIASLVLKTPLANGLRWMDVFGVAILAGIGFTVSLLIGDLAFGAGTARDDHVKVGVLAGSVLAAVLATVVLRLRNRRYRLLEQEETVDDDHDGIPDVFLADQQ